MKFSGFANTQIPGFIKLATSQKPLSNVKSKSQFLVVITKQCGYEYQVFTEFTLLKLIQPYILNAATV